MSSESVQNELQNLALNSRRQNTRRIRMSLLIAALIAILALKTQWITLQPGLLILLAGQLAFAAFLGFRNRRLPQHLAVDEWFDQEIAATRQAAWLENGPRILGFILLAVGVWRATGNALVSLALGVIYPALLCWGLARATSRQTARRFESQRERLHAMNSPH